jgi:hypothetical protein
LLDIGRSLLNGARDCVDFIGDRGESIAGEPSLFLALLYKVGQVGVCSTLLLLLARQVRVECQTLVDSVADRL